MKETQPLIIKKSQLPEFKIQAHLLCEKLSNITKKKQLRGNKALNLYSNLFGHNSYQSILVESKKHYESKETAIKKIIITKARLAFMSDFLVDRFHVSKALITPMLTELYTLDSMVFSGSIKRYQDDLELLNYMNEKTPNNTICNENNFESLSLNDQTEMISLAQKATGLVVFVGYVGCGKTALMNEWLEIVSGLKNKVKKTPKSFPEITDQKSASNAIKNSFSNLVSVTYTISKHNSNIDIPLLYRTFGATDVTIVEVYSKDNNPQIEIVRNMRYENLFFANELPIPRYLLIMDEFFCFSGK